MAKQTGRTGRKKKLGLLYWERESLNEHLFISGLLRGWPSEDWSKKTGEPILYRFIWICLHGKLKGKKISLYVTRSDRNEVELDKNDRTDLRNGIDWHVSEYLPDRIEEIPNAQRLMDVKRQAITFFTQPNVNTPEFLETWEKDWKIVKESIINEGTKGQN